MCIASIQLGADVCVLSCSRTLFHLSLSLRNVVGFSFEHIRTMYNWYIHKTVFRLCHNIHRHETKLNVILHLNCWCLFRSVSDDVCTGTGNRRWLHYVSVHTNTHIRLIRQPFVFVTNSLEVNGWAKRAHTERGRTRGGRERENENTLVDKWWGNDNNNNKKQTCKIRTSITSRPHHK